MQQDHLTLCVIFYILLKIKGVNFRFFQALMQQKFDFYAFLKNDSQYFKKFFISEKIVQHFRFFSYKQVRNHLNCLQEQGITMLTVLDSLYPEALKAIHGYPLLLYTQGDLSLLNNSSPKLAVVGTRKSSPYGLKVTQRLISDLIAHDVIIVSGMAAGIDTAAHLATIEAEGKTIAVLGGGFYHIYPRQNLQVFKRIISHGGLIISEYEPTVEPRRPFFPQRNRIISGLCCGVLIVQGSQRSGSLITARLGLEQGRNIYAVPGNIDSPQSYGTNSLIKEGAKLVQNSKDILEDYPFNNELKFPDTYTQPSKADLSLTDLEPEQQLIINILSQEDKNIDQLAIESGFSAAKLISLLLSLVVLINLAITSG